MTDPLTAERVVGLEGATNFRDLGGYPTADGGRTRWCRVFRSDALHRLTPADVAAVARLGLRAVYDLRTEEERLRSPSVLPDGIRCEWLAVGGTAGKLDEIGGRIMRGDLGAVPADFLERVYPVMAEATAPAFGRLLTGLAEPDGLPALFHCTAGKDRTGLAAALLLSVLGVDEATVLDDYELSGVPYTERRIARLRPRLAAAGIEPEHYRTGFGVSRVAMARLLASLREQFGSIEAYLMERAGVAPRTLTALRGQLVEPSPAAGH